MTPKRRGVIFDPKHKRDHMTTATKPQTAKPQLIDSMGWEAGLEMHFQGTTAKVFESVTIKDAMSDLQNDIDALEATMAPLESFTEAVLDLPVLAIDFGHYGVSKTERKQIDKTRAKVLAEHGGTLVKHVRDTIY